MGDSKLDNLKVVEFLQRLFDHFERIRIRSSCRLIYLLTTQNVAIVLMDILELDRVILVVYHFID
jgi:hypothetical protein